MKHELKVQLPPEIRIEEAKLLLMIKLYETGQLSIGQAAKSGGYSIQAFMELLGKYGVSVFDYSPDDLEEEMNS